MNKKEVEIAAEFIYRLCLPKVGVFKNWKDMKSWEKYGWLEVAQTLVEMLGFNKNN